MNKWAARLYIPAMLLVMAIGVFTILRYGYKPAPVAVMEPSYFDSPEAIGNEVFEHFDAAIGQKRRVAIGIPPQPEWYRHVVVGFLKGAKANERAFDVIVMEEQMPDLPLEGLSIPVVKLRTNTQPPIDILEALKQFETQGKRVLIYMPSIFTAHVLQASPLHRIERHLGTNVLSISVGPLALRPDQEYLVQPSCVGAERDSTGTSDYGCVILNAGRMQYRKKVKQDRWVAIMNAPNPEDYVLMISTPGQDKLDSATANEQLRMAPPAAPAAPGN